MGIVELSEKSNFRSLYDEHKAYVERRHTGSLVAREIAHEAATFKVPNLISVIPTDLSVFHSIVEIGCATGEVLAAFPDNTAMGDRIEKIGFDISPLNLAAAQSRYPHIRFLDEDFTESKIIADLVVLSDILEHVPDDVDFLRAASRLGKIVLVNLPLEDNWANRNRHYGIKDESGHLRAYSLEDGFALADRSDLEILQWRRVWKHETDYDLERRTLRRTGTGTSHSGGPIVRLIKTIVYFAARGISPFGRRLFASNLFFSAKGKKAYRRQ